MKKTLITLILISCISLGYSQDDFFIQMENENIKKSETVEEGKPLPEINLPSINGELINLEKFKGKYIYLNFWATWCKPCIENMPAYEKLIKKHKNDNIEFVYISVDDLKEDWEKFVQEKQLGGINLFAAGMQTEPISDFISGYFTDENGDKVSVVEIPAYVLIDPNGTIIENDLVEKSKEEIAQLLDKLLK